MCLSAEYEFSVEVARPKCHAIHSLAAEDFAESSQGQPCQSKSTSASLPLYSLLSVIVMINYSEFCPFTSMEV